MNYSAIIGKLIIVILYLSTLQCITAQQDSSAYVKGRIIFRIKNEYKKLIPSGKDTVNIKEVAFLRDYFNKYKLTLLLNPYGDADEATISGKNLRNTYILYFDTLINQDEIINELKKINCIDYTEKTPCAQLLYVPNDSLYTTSIKGANPIWLYKLINVEKAWDYTHGSPKVKVALIDNAFWTSHPDLQGKFVEIKDFSNNDNNTDPPASSTNQQLWGHGTHIAGLIGAKTSNKRGIASIGFDVSMMAYKICPDASLPTPDITDGIKAIQWAADKKADIINISWGTTIPTQALEDAVNYAHSKGCVIVAAAGNSGKEQNYYPAAYSNVIAVTSVGMDDKKSYFSSYGSFVDLASPGGYGPTDAGAWSPVSTVPYNAISWAQILGNIKYDGKVGTSIATPVVSGLCGLMLSLDSTLTPSEVENILKITSVNIDAKNPSYSGKLGVGRINAGAALEYVHNKITSTRNISSSESIKIFPNPCNDILMIRFSDKNYISLTDIHIYNTLGQLVYSEKVNINSIADSTFSINISGLIPGLYIIKIINSGERAFFDFIKR